jgi:hypothetical protein
MTTGTIARRTRGRLRRVALLLSVLAGGLIVDTDVGQWPVRGPLEPAAEAWIGHPRTPASVAGVARRTTRRVIRRSATYIAVLPRGCGGVTINGVALYRCGGSYYQPYGGRYVVVYVD